MLASKLYSPTLRETPADAEVVSHQLMLRAGFIRKIGGGLYTYLPLAWRTLRKIEQIVREEMDGIGAQEFLMPILQPAELWMETGRWLVYGDEMFRVQDRHTRAYCLAPTHEELITSVVKMDINSYKQLPLILYQIQNKYRDEIRPRFGLMRSREFIMKDAYSFDATEEGLDQQYKQMYDAYQRIFTRCGLNFRPVEADSGAIGGSGSHEFMAFADSGEAAVVYCTSCDFAANIEVAVPVSPDTESARSTIEIEAVETPECKTIDDLVNLFSTSAEAIIKVVAFSHQEQIIMAVVMGSRDVNEVRLASLFGEVELPLATDEDLRRSGLIPGYISPIGMIPSDKLVIIVDPEVMKANDVICGGNEEGIHFRHVCPARDFTEVRVETIRMITEKDVCPCCAGKIKITRGIEVGQVFKLGTKYSEALGATFLDNNGKSKPMIMGCYGVGVSRTMAAVIEQNSDEHGIVWPVSITPYEVAIIPANNKDEAIFACAMDIYNELQNAGIEVVLDDRNERAGIKFKDADLIGYPIRITIGKKWVENDTIEIKNRKTGEVHEEVKGNVLRTIRKILET